MEDSKKKKEMKKEKKDPVLIDGIYVYERQYDDKGLTIYGADYILDEKGISGSEYVAGKDMKLFRNDKDAVIKHIKENNKSIGEGELKLMFMFNSANVNVGSGNMEQEYLKKCKEAVKKYIKENSL